MPDLVAVLLTEDELLACVEAEADASFWGQRICINTCQDTLRRRQSRENLDRALRREALWQNPADTVHPQGGGGFVAGLRGPAAGARWAYAGAESGRGAARH